MIVGAAVGHHMAMKNQEGQQAEAYEEPAPAVYLSADIQHVISYWQFYLQMRELFGDIYLEKSKNAWVRIGLAKVPYGYENLQSSSQRLPFDRDDAINSGVPGERDLGAFFIWGTSKAHRTLRAMADSGYKGEGDFGIFAIGVYNGQGANKPEANDRPDCAAAVGP